jgi:hypothetical protein
MHRCDHGLSEREGYPPALVMELVLVALERIDDLGGDPDGIKLMPASPQRQRKDALERSPLASNPELASWVSAKLARQVFREGIAIRLIEARITS